MTVSGETPMVLAVDHWNCENVRLETVLDPAMNAPRAPTKGAKNGHVSPATDEAASARSTGINSIPDSLMPDWISTRTMGTANSRATAVPKIWRPAIFHVWATCLADMR